MGAYLSTFSTACPPSCTPRCWPGSTPRPPFTCRRWTPGSPTPRRWTPTAAPAGPRPPTCSSASSDAAATGKWASRQDEIRRRNFITSSRTNAGGAAVRHWRLPRLHEARMELADVAGFEARRKASGSQGQAARHRLQLLHRGLRPGAEQHRRGLGRTGRPVRGRRGARAPHRQRDGVHRLAQPRPGARDHLCAGGGRPSSASRSRTSTSCTATPARCRSAWAPTARARIGGRCGHRRALDKIIAKGKKIAAHLLEASDADIEFEGGEFKVAGTDKKVASGRWRWRPTCRTTTRWTSWSRA
jgi:aerobic carbon-monoxide dehydrogenase large subunit